MAVKSSFMYAGAVIVFTCVCNVYGQQGATPAPCNTSYLGDYQCNDGNGCYDENDKCDYYNRCADKTDDLNCDSCTGSYYTSVFYCVLSRQCVSESVVCNGDPDCLNGEDEDVTFCSTRCTSGYGDYQCKDGNWCYSDYNKCDSHNACADKTDDLNCDSCETDSAFYCVLSRQCVYDGLVCNGHPDCLNGEDENVTICSTRCTSFYNNAEHQCNDGNGCYSDNDKCDTYNACNDTTDELNCDSCKTSSDFYCVLSRQCVSESVVCDGHPDCLNGEDENQHYCSTRCTSGYGEYQCNDGNGCYDDYDKCNSFNACIDNTDDLNCDSCNDSRAFYCHLSRQCVRKYVVCNGHPDCINGEDEPLQCFPTIWMYWSGGQMAGIIIGYVLFLVIVIVIVVAVRKNGKTLETTTV